MHIIQVHTEKQEEKKVEWYILGKSSNLLKFDHFAWSGIEKKDFKPSIEGERDQNETIVQHIIENGFGTCFHLNYYE